MLSTADLYWRKQKCLKVISGRFFQSNSQSSIQYVLELGRLSAWTEHSQRKCCKFSLIYPQVCPGTSCNPSRPSLLFSPCSLISKRKSIFHCWWSLLFPSIKDHESNSQSIILPAKMFGCIECSILKFPSSRNQSNKGCKSQ